MFLFGSRGPWPGLPTPFRGNFSFAQLVLFARWWEKYLPKCCQHKQTGSREDKTVLSEHSTTKSNIPIEFGWNWRGENKTSQHSLLKSHICRIRKLDPAVNEDYLIQENSFELIRFWTPPSHTHTPFLESNFLTLSSEDILFQSSPNK